MLAASLAAPCLAANGSPADGRTDPGGSGYGYTDHATRASQGRAIALYIDDDFDQAERQRILLAVRQWNHVLNGFVQFRPQLFQGEPTPRDLAQIRRAGGWFVARIDSRHPVARQREAQQAMGMTVGNPGGNPGGGVVYVISDRFGPAELTAVALHELGHVLGAGHDDHGRLMASVYVVGNGRCIDRGAVAMVAQARRLPLSQLNWCVGPGL